MAIDAPDRKEQWFVLRGSKKRLFDDRVLSRCYLGLLKFLHGRASEGETMAFERTDSTNKQTEKSAESEIMNSLGGNLLSQPQEKAVNNKATNDAASNSVPKVSMDKDGFTFSAVSSKPVEWTEDDQQDWGLGNGTGVGQ